MADGDRDRVRTLVEKVGEYAAANHLHVTRWTVGRILGGLPLQEATRALVVSRLDDERVAAAS